MKVLCLFLLMLIGISGRSQSDYLIRIFDKNEGVQITDYTIDFNDTSFTVKYGNSEIYLNIPKFRLDYAYIDIFLDTTNNPDNCWILWMQDSPSVGVHQRKSQFCMDSNSHYVRNLSYLDTNPLNAFNFSDFFEVNDDLFIGATFGYSYSGLMLGATMKLYQSAFGGYGYYVINGEYAVVLTGTNKSGVEYGAGIRIGPVLPFGVSINSFVMDNKYSLNIRPEVGLDLGKYSLVYGYNIGIINNHDLHVRDRHSIKISYAFNISRPVKNWRKKFPYDTFR